MEMGLRVEHRLGKGAESSSYQEEREERGEWLLEKRNNK
jgi:hypothetical protein